MKHLNSFYHNTDKCQHNFSVGILVLINYQHITISFSSQHLYLLKCDIKMLLKVNQWLFTSLAMEGNYFFFKNSIYLLKFAIYIYIYVYLYLSHKLWCYTRISGPEKSGNNMREKISYFSRVLI